MTDRPDAPIAEADARALLHLCEELAVMVTVRDGFVLDADQAVEGLGVQLPIAGVLAYLRLRARVPREGEAG